MPQRELILRMKKARIEQGVTYDDIVDMTLSAGVPVSISSVKRVFAAGSETKDFRDETTLIPIARTLLTPEEIREVLTIDSGHLDTNYQIIIKMKEEMIDVLNRQIEAMQADDEKKVEYLKKDILRQRKIIWSLVTVLAVVLAAIIAVLIYDKANPNVGWFRDSSLFAMAPFNIFRTFVRPL